MGFFDIFAAKKKFEPLNIPVLRDEVYTGELPKLVAPTSVIIKKLKWVVCYDQYLGIITKVLDNNVVEVDYVDSEGLTYASDKVPFGNIRLARFLEIPEKRRVGLTAAQAAVLGYC